MSAGLALGEEFMARVRSARTELAELLNSAVAPVYVLDDQRRIVYCNPALATWVGEPVERIVGLQCDYHSVPADSPAPAIAAGLCPPPEAFSGRVTSGVVAAHRSITSAQRRRAEFVPLGKDAVHCRGVIAVLDEADLPAQTAAAADELSEPAALHEQIRQYRRQAKHHHSLDRLLGESQLIRRARDQVALAAGSQARVVLVGPKGSGRQHLARAIHYSQQQAGAASLVPLDCTLLDSELLQSIVSAFVRQWTELQKDQPSALLLLDIDRLDAAAQRDLMGFLDIREFGLSHDRHGQPRPGGIGPAGPVSIRSGLCAEHAGHRAAQSRPADRGPAAVGPNGVGGLERRGRCELAGFAPETMDQMISYTWPGNWDELVPAIRTAHQHAEGPWVQPADLPESLSLAADAMAHPPRQEQNVQLDALLQGVETELIKRALRRAKGNRARAARLLGISRTRLLRRMTQLGLEQ